MSNVRLTGITRDAFFKWIYVNEKKIPSAITLIDDLIIDFLNECGMKTNFKFNNNKKKFTFEFEINGRTFLKNDSFTSIEKAKEQAVIEWNKSLNIMKN